MSDKTPVTILTGALGSGKTTLIRSLLGQLPGSKILIIENEFAPVSIDGQILEDSLPKMDIVELSNGCICCNIRGELVSSLLDYLKEGHQYDRVIIECTGVADPSQIAAAFGPMSVLSASFVIDSTLCLVDAKNHFLSKVQKEIYEKQIVFSDRILLSKTDLITSEQREEVEKDLKGIHPTGTLLEVVNGEIDSKKVLDLFCYSFKNFMTVVKIASPFLGARTVDRPLDHQLKSSVFRFNGKFDRARFEIFLSVFYMTHPEQIIRSKGILCFKDVSHKIYFHAVYDQFSFASALESEEEKDESVLIFIGQDIREEYLEKGLNQCLV